jgi:hypothetical protein
MMYVARPRPRDTREGRCRHRLTEKGSHERYTPKDLSRGHHRVTLHPHQHTHAHTRLCARSLSRFRRRRRARAVLSSPHTLEPIIRALSAAAHRSWRPGPAESRQRNLLAAQPSDVAHDLAHEHGSAHEKSAARRGPAQGGLRPSQAREARPINGRPSMQTVCCVHGRSVWARASSPQCTHDGCPEPPTTEVDERARRRAEARITPPRRHAVVHHGVHDGVRSGLGEWQQADHE